jgi:hypothetical protein
MLRISLLCLFLAVTLLDATAQSDLFNYTVRNPSDLLKKQDPIKLFRSGVYAFCSETEVDEKRPYKEDSMFISQQGDSILVYYLDFLRNKYPKLRMIKNYTIDGKIRSESEYSGSVCNSIKYYDKNGNETRSYQATNFTCDGVQRDSFYCDQYKEYNDQGQLTTVWDYRTDQTVFDKIVTRYNLNGNKTEELYFRQESDWEKPDSLTYSEFINLHEKHQMPLNLETHDVYITDSVKRTIAHKHFKDTSSIPSMISTDFFDKKWRLVKSVSINFNGNSHLQSFEDILRSLKKDFMDIKRSLTKTLSKESKKKARDSSLNTELFTYDTFGNRTSYVRILNGKVVERESLKYDGLGRIIHSSYYQNFGKELHSTGSVTGHYDQKENLDEISYTVHGSYENADNGKSRIRLYYK